MLSQNNQESIFPDLQDKVFLSPTDTILGLGALANSEQAVKRIAQIKNRPNEKPFILLVEDFVRLRSLVEVTPLHEHLIIHSERPTTIVYDKVKNVAKHLLAEDGSIAIRLISLPSVSGIIRYFDQPLVSTSANISGEAAPMSYNQISKEVLDQIDYIFPNSFDFIPNYPASIVLKVEDNKVKILRD